MAGQQPNFLRHHHSGHVPDSGALCCVVFVPSVREISMGCCLTACLLPCSSWPPTLVGSCPTCMSRHGRRHKRIRPPTTQLPKIQCMKTKRRNPRCGNHIVYSLHRPGLAAIGSSTVFNVGSATVVVLTGQPVACRVTRVVLRDLSTTLAQSIDR